MRIEHKTNSKNHTEGWFIQNKLCSPSWIATGFWHVRFGRAKSVHNMAENEVDQHILDRFEIQQKLGKGHYGVVWRVQEKNPDYGTFALKKIFDVFFLSFTLQLPISFVGFSKCHRRPANVS
jgi:hypothetical protein